jgi:hemerythrin-like domain-containing protein
VLPWLDWASHPGGVRIEEGRMSEQQRDVIEILTTDHREVEEMFKELETLMAAGGNADQERRRQVVDQVTVELVRHAVAEEVAVYPAVKDKVSAEEAERAKREHAEAEETMKRLERLDPDDASFDGEIRTLMAEIREHVAEEEGQMFPHMRQVMSQEELVSLGGKVESIKKMAPTRPHPNVPNEPGVRSALGPVAGLFDRLRDLATGRAEEE